MIDLLDVNVLVSLAWPNHVHHEVSSQWFARRTAGSKWATTAVTESGFVRVSSNRAAIPSAATPRDALAILDEIRRVDGHLFLADDLEAVTGDLVDARLLLSHRQVTDAHLLALARRHGARLVTLDRGVAALAGSGAADLLVVPADLTKS